MPEKSTIQRAKKKKEQGRAASTQAGEFVREEMEHLRKGKHGARSTKQAIAIGLSKARKAGVKVAPKGRKQASSSETTKQSHKPSKKRSQATLEALKREPHSAASHRSLSRQAHRSAKARGPEARQAAAQKAVRTKGSKLLSTAARKAAKTRAEHATHTH